MSGHDNMERFKEGSKRNAERMGYLIRQSQRRRDILVARLMPLLSQETAGKITEYRRYVTRSNFTDAELLKQHLESLIEDFDCIIHYLEEDEMPALAEVINRKPLISKPLTSFFFDED